MVDQRVLRRRLARFRSLDPRDRRLLLSAFALLALLRTALLLASFRRLRGTLERVKPRSRLPAPPVGEADRVGWAVRSAARYVPGANCLPQALAADTILRRRGHRADLKIGVTRGPEGIEAHAWVEADGHVIVGDDITGFVPLEGRGTASPNDEPATEGGS